MNYYFDAWRKYAEFSGRASRKEYWMFTLFDQLIHWGLYIPVLMSDMGTEGEEMSDGEMFLGLAWGLYILAVLLPRLSISVRRLHDSGKSGFMVLLGLVPMIGGLIMLYLFTRESDPGENEYGYPVHRQYDTVFE